MPDRRSYGLQYKNATDGTDQMHRVVGVCDVNIGILLRFHRSHGKIATLTAVKRDQSKGVLNIRFDNSVKAFREKDASDSAPINAGFMVFNPEIFDYIEGDHTVLEKEPLERLAAEDELISYQHKGFWRCMDNIREKEMLESLLETGEAPWKVWSD